MADVIPFGDTSGLAIVSAIVLADLVNIPFGGNVDIVFTFCDHFMVITSLVCK